MIIIQIMIHGKCAAVKWHLHGTSQRFTLASHSPNHTRQDIKALSIPIESNCGSGSFPRALQHVDSWSLDLNH